MSTLYASDTKSIKYGSVTINKVMRGSEQIWPLNGFQSFILKQGNNYYTVTGISNNEYQKTVFDNSITCPLVYIEDMSFHTGIEVVPKCQYEYGICGFNGPILYDERLKSSDKGCANISNRTYNNRLYWDYMGAAAAGTSTNQQYITDTTVVYQTQNSTAYIYNFALEPVPNYTNRYYKKIYRTDYTNNGSKTQLASTTVYDYAASSQQSYMDGHYWHIGDANNASGSKGGMFWCYFYYAKFFDYDENLIGFYHFKSDNGQLKMYDEVSKSFLTSTSGDDAELTQVLDKSITFETPILNYYEADGTITEDGVTYEKLVNSLDNTKYIKGIAVQ